MKVHTTRLRLAGTVMALSALLASPASAHCYAPQHCIPDPLNAHHGGAGLPPRVKEVVGALQNIAGQARAGTVAGVFTVVEIETLEVPAGAPERERAGFVPKVDAPKEAAAPGQLSAGPLTPAAFARQALAVQTPQDLALVKQGVLDSSRTLLDVAAGDKMLSTSAATASARMLAHHLANSSEALSQLRQYDEIMKTTRDLKGGGRRPTNLLWEDMEKLARYSQSILQRGSVAR